jgi:sec-independent protein translocase protein TatA
MAGGTVDSLVADWQEVMVSPAAVELVGPSPQKDSVMGNIGAGELLLIAFVALLVFGAGRVADIGKGLGQGIRNFKEGLRGEADDEPKKKAPAEKKESEA